MPHLNEPLAKNIQVISASLKDLSAIIDFFKKERQYHQQFDLLFELTPECEGLSFFNKFLQNPNDLIRAESCSKSY